MSSFIRRIQRQQHPSQRVHLMKDEKGKVIRDKDGNAILYENPPRQIFYNGRGSRLGVVNAEAKDLIARLEREEKRKVE